MCDMCVQNIRTLSQYYSRISSTRLAFFLQLDGEKAEKYLSEMVSSKQLYAKIDRPTGIVTFARKRTANDVLESWSNDIDTLLGLVENTCHLINKENMLHLARKQAAGEAPALTSSTTTSSSAMDTKVDTKVDDKPAASPSSASSDSVKKMDL